MSNCEDETNCCDKCGKNLTIIEAAYCKECIQQADDYLRTKELIPIMIEGKFVNQKFALYNSLIQKTVLVMHLSQN